jgi:hypothetical protein
MASAIGLSSFDTFLARSSPEIDLPPLLTAHNGILCFGFQGATGVDDFVSSISGLLTLLTCPVCCILFCPILSIFIIYSFL